ncbi:MAG TPA: hypothetical protein VGN00_01905 [Puia sp.]|jgi:hypothetical protein
MIETRLRACKEHVIRKGRQLPARKGGGQVVEVPDDHELLYFQSYTNYLCPVTKVT